MVRFQPLSIGLRLACVSALALSAAGCASVGMGGSKEPELPITGSNRTPTEQFGVNVQQVPDRIQLLPAAGALSPAQVGALDQLARRWAEDGQGAITIETPAGGQNAAVASQAAYAAQRVLLDAGVNPSAVTMTAYNATGQAAATVAVGFMKYEVAVPDCAQFHTDVTKTGDNKPTRAFGCAVTANMAVMIADPEDLLAPKPMGAADTARRSVVLGAYRDGKPTGTPRSPNPNESGASGAE